MKFSELLERGEAYRQEQGFESLRGAWYVPLADGQCKVCPITAAVASQKGREAITEMVEDEALTRFWEYLTLTNVLPLLLDEPAKLSPEYVMEETDNDLLDLRQADDIMCWTFISYDRGASLNWIVRQLSNAGL